MLPCSEISSPKSGQTARRAFPGWGMVRRASSLWSTNPTPHGDELTEGGDPPTKRFRGTSPTDDNTHSVQHFCVYSGQRDGWDPSSISFHWRGRSCRRKGSRADFRPQVDQSKAPFAEHPLDPITADPLRLRGSFVRRRGTGPGDVCRGGGGGTGGAGPTPGEVTVRSKSSSPSEGGFRRSEKDRSSPRIKTLSKLNTAVEHATGTGRQPRSATRLYTIPVGRRKPLQQFDDSQPAGIRQHQPRGRQPVEEQIGQRAALNVFRLRRAVSIGAADARCLDRLVPRDVAGHSAEAELRRAGPADRRQSIRERFRGAATPVV